MVVKGSPYTAGERHSKVVLVEPDIGSRQQSRWICDCDCGRRFSCNASKLRTGHTKSCGCLRPNFSNTKKDLTGLRFGRLLVISSSGGSNRVSKWKCVCDCGKEIEVAGRGLRERTTRSCGCLQSEAAKRNVKKAHAAATVHGFWGMPEHNIWHGIRHRCTTEGSKYFKKGIKVCSRWFNSFEAFLSDVGERPEDKVSIDRINTRGHYSCGKCEECAANGWPMNCRWATMKEQARNTTRSRMIEFDGAARTIAEVSEITGMPPKVLWRRIKAGWTVDLAVSIPVGSIATRSPMKK